MEIILFLTRNCNLRCDYCYQPRKEATSMPPETVRRAIQLAAEGADAHLGVCLFGGEPTMAPSLIEEAVSCARRECDMRSLGCYFSISTNGTLLTPRILGLLEAHDFLVQFSIDGDAAMHDRHRRFRNGRGTHGRALAGLRALVGRVPAVEVVTVVAPDTADRMARGIAFLHEAAGVSAFALNVSYSSSWDAESVARLKSSLDQVADMVMASYRSGVPIAVNLLDEKIESWTQGGYLPHEHCPFGKGKFAVDVDGTLYPCDRLAQVAGEPEFAIGSVWDGLDVRRVLELRECLSRVTRPECEDCSAAGRCRNWCGCVNRESTAHINHVSDFFCHLERVKVRIADRIGETLWAERNEPFMTRFGLEETP